MVAVWLGIILVLVLACATLYKVRRLDNPPAPALWCAALGGGGAVGLTALPVAAAGGVDTAGVVGAGLLLSAVAAPLCWLLLTTPQGWTRPDHGHPQFATETAAAQPQPVPVRDPSKYRVKSAAEAMAEAQGIGAPRSARVRRIMDMEV